MKKQILFFLLLLVTSVLNAQLKVNPSGNIEIGTSPTTTYKLNLAGSSRLNGDSYITGNLGIGIAPTTTYKLNFLGNSYFNGTNTFVGGNFDYIGPSITYYGTGFKVSGGNNYPAMGITAESTFSGNELLFVGGIISAAGYTNNSDSQLKKNIKVLDCDQMLLKILNIDGKKYEFINNEELELVYKKIKSANGNDKLNKLMNLPKGERYGFIAQEIEKEFPELVKTDSITNLKSVDYDGMIPILLQSIKEQQKMIIELQTKVESLSSLTK